MVTTASDACMSIVERCFLNPVFWKRGQRRPTPFCVNGESADVPENIAVAWWALSFPRYATATYRQGLHPKAINFLCVR